MSIPRIFDRALHRARRARAARMALPGAGFLLDRALDDICERLAFVLRDFHHVLLIGGHDGSPLTRLQACLPDAKISVIESTPVSQARFAGSLIPGSEEALGVAAGSYDCVVAPLSLSTIDDLPGVLRQVCLALKPDGLFLGALAGGRTLVELAEAFAIAESEVRGGASLRVAPRIDVRDLGALLQRAGFALPVVDSDCVTVTYASPIDLMRELRAMGATNILVERSRVPLTRAVLARVCEVYIDRFARADGRIPATLELLTMTAWAPHPDQQKPLKPGSASHRLADALGTVETKLERD